MRCVAITLVGLLAACGPQPRVGEPAAAPAPVAPTPSEPIAAWFGTWRADTGAFERAAIPRAIDKVPGLTFGWRIKTHCTGPVKFREVMRLPSPGDWTFTPDELPSTTISADRTTTTTVDYAACKHGWVEHRWQIADDDPSGTYVITVELDGYAKATFRAKFVAPPP